MTVLHILIVEDDPVQAESLKRLFLGWYPDWRVTEAGDERSALERLDELAAESDLPDLAIIDRQLRHRRDALAGDAPESDIGAEDPASSPGFRRDAGYRVLRHLRNLPGGEDTPVLMLSVLSSSEEEHDHDLVAYLRKTASDDDLYETSRSLLAAAHRDPPERRRRVVRAATESSVVRIAAFIAATLFLITVVTNAASSISDRVRSDEEPATYGYVVAISGGTGTYASPNEGSLTDNTPLPVGTGVKVLCRRDTLPASASAVGPAWWVRLDTDLWLPGVHVLPASQEPVLPDQLPECPGDG